MFKHAFLLKAHKGLLTFLVFFGFTFGTFSQNFTNGGLERPAGSITGPTTGSVMPGWDYVDFSSPICFATAFWAATADILDINGPVMVPSGIFGNPQGGQTFIAGIYSGNAGGQIWHEGMQQTVDCFIIGETYEISFFQTVVKQINHLDQSGSWSVYVDNTLIGTTAPSVSTLAFDDPNLIWEQRIVSFTATANTHTIQFMPADDDANIIASTTDITGAIRMGLDEVQIVPTPVVIDPVPPLCLNEPPFDLTATPPGGTWSGTGIVDANAGTFDPSVAGVGTHTITYTVVGLCTTLVETVDIIVNTAFDATITPAGPFCSGDPAFNLTAVDGGGTWTGTGIVDANAGTFDPAAAGVGTHTITYTIPGACGDTQTADIIVTNGADATWAAPTGLCIGNAPVDLSALVTGTPGGTFSGTGITGNMFDPSVGTQTITYSVGVAPCDAILALQITVVPAADATWSAPVGLCAGNAPVDLSALVTGTAGGTFTGTGITGNMFDPAVGTQTITYSVGIAPCDDVLALQILVVPSADASWTIPTGLCTTGAPIDLSTFITGNTGGTFTGTGITGNFFDPSVGTQTITYTAGTAPCDDVLAQQITVDLPLSAGLDSTMTICGSNPNILNLSTLLNGADLGGQWQETSVTASGQFSTTQGQLTLTGLAEGLYTFTYTQNANSNCALDVATITINYGVTGNAGIDGQVIICQDNGLVDLFSLISGNPDAGGTWSPATNAGNGIFDPSVDNSGTFSYVVYSSPFCIQDTSKATIDVINVANIQIVGPAELCLGDGAQAYTSNVPNGTWSGQGISNQGILNPAGLNSGSTTITYTYDSLGCQSSSDFTIALNDAPTVEIYYYGELCDDEEQFIAPIVTNATNYFWSDGYSDLNRIIQGDYSLIDQTIQLTLTAENFCGTANETISINVNQCGETVYVPNAFTPDGDEFNQTFKPVLTGIDIHSYQMVIFNRWGELIFETNNPEVGWDGTYGGEVVQDGTYTWSLQYKLPNEDGNTRLLGHVNLIR